MVPGNTFNKDLVLAWLLHHLPMDTRRKLTAALPEAYNDVCCQREVAVVVYKDDLPAGVATVASLVPK